MFFFLKHGVLDSIYRISCANTFIFVRDIE